MKKAKNYAQTPEMPSVTQTHTVFKIIIISSMISLALTPKTDYHIFHEHAYS